MSIAFEEPRMFRDEKCMIAYDFFMGFIQTNMLQTYKPCIWKKQISQWGRNFRFGLCPKFWCWPWSPFTLGFVPLVPQYEEQKLRRRRWTVYGWKTNPYTVREIFGFDVKSYYGFSKGLWIFNIRIAFDAFKWRSCVNLPNHDALRFCVSPSLCKRLKVHNDETFFP